MADPAKPAEPAADPAPKSDVKSDLKSEASGIPVAGESKSDAALSIDAMKKEENIIKKTVEHTIAKAGVTIGVVIKAGKVAAIWPASDLLGKIFVGDMIETVNGKVVKNTGDFLVGVYRQMPGKTVIELKRDEHCTVTTKPLKATKPNTELLEVTLLWRGGGAPLGLLIHRDYQKRIVVAVVNSSAPTAKAVKAGDFLLKINNKDVADRDMARKMIVESINSSKKVVLTLERPTSDAAVVTPPTQSPSGTSIAGTSPSATASAPAAAPAAAGAAPAAPAIAAKPVTADSDYTPTQYGAPPPDPAPSAAPTTPAPTPAAAPGSAPASAPAAPATVPQDAEYTPTTIGAVNPAIPPPADDEPLISTPAPNAPPPPPPKPEPKMPVIDAKVNKKIDQALAADVIKIMEENRKFFMVKCILPPCLKPKGTDKCAAHTEMSTAKPEETQIPYDPSKKALKTTPKRVGS